MFDWQIKRIQNQQGNLTKVQYGPEAQLTIPMLQNESTGLVPVLQLLSASDSNVTSFAYCHPAVNHTTNRFKEAGVCGYRCIAMLLSYLRGCSTAHKNDSYNDALPNILEIQDLIENAWAQNINSHAREEIGSIRGTRKYIGTTEVDACLQYLGAPCAVQVISPTTDSGAPCDALLQYVERYFHNVSPSDNPLGKPPIFLQRHGHSVVIVGIEYWKKRQVRYPKIELVDSPYLSNLVVFDCSVKVLNAMKSLRDTPRVDTGKHLPLISKYRLDRHQLEKYDRFELVYLTERSLSS